MAATRVRDTRSGKFAKRGEAKRRPATTVTERVSKRELLLEQLVFDLHVQLETAVTLLQRMRALSMETPFAPMCEVLNISAGIGKPRKAARK